MTARTKMALVCGFLASSIAAVGLYGLLRIVQAHLFREANPATVVWSAHAGYFWRMWTVAYAGVMAGFAGFAAARAAPERTVRVLVHALSVATVIIAYQGFFVP